MVSSMRRHSVRIDSLTHDTLKRLAAAMGTTMGETVALAVRALRQQQIGNELSAPLRADERSWLGADFG
jgi:hypothetical protein